MLNSQFNKSSNLFRHPFSSQFTSNLCKWFQFNSNLFQFSNLCNKWFQPNSSSNYISHNK